MLLGDYVDVAAGPTSVIGKIEQVPYLFEREAEVAGAPDEAQPTKVFLPVSTIVAEGAVRSRQELDMLIVPNCFDFCAGCAGKMANRERFYCHGIDPVVARGSI